MSDLDDRLDDFEWYNRAPGAKYVPMTRIESPVKISSNFDSGNIEVIDASDHEHMRLAIRPEPYTEGTDKKCRKRSPCPKQRSAHRVQSWHNSALTVLTQPTPRC